MPHKPTGRDIQPMSDMKPVAQDSPQADRDGREPRSDVDMEHVQDEELDTPQKPDESEDVATGEKHGPALEQSEEVSTESQVQALQAELEQAQAQATEYLEGWQRARAEFANYKRRVETEREELRRASNEALLLKLLPVVDDFERAFQTLPEDLADVPWMNGIKMIFRKLQALLESENVTPIQAEGQPFDPLLHEAVIQEETDEYPDEHVMEEMQRGYRLGERVLRPSMVKVASNANQSSQEEQD
jgi:molecular chaperone GrpE